MYHRNYVIYVCLNAHCRIIFLLTLEFPSSIIGDCAVLIYYNYKNQHIEYNVCASLLLLLGSTVFEDDLS